MKRYFKCVCFYLVAICFLTYAAWGEEAPDVNFEATETEIHNMMDDFDQEIDSWLDEINETTEKLDLVMEGIDAEHERLAELHRQEALLEVAIPDTWEISIEDEDGEGERETVPDLSSLD